MAERRKEVSTTFEDIAYLEKRLAEAATPEDRARYEKMLILARDSHDAMLEQKLNTKLLKG